MSFSRWLSLFLYYHATWPYRRWRNWRAACRHALPLVILFYHRVADDRTTARTMPSRLFARQICWLQRHFELISLEEVQRRIRDGDNSRPSVSITFDDGYADNCLEAIPLLIAQRIPCTYFVTLDNVLRGEPFPHDLKLGRRLAPNSLDQLRAMAASGIEIGAHGRHHLDFGRIKDPAQLEDELVIAGRELADHLGQAVRYLAFPFGLRSNFNPEALLLARQAGYLGVCSAYGGYNFPGTSWFHLRRFHANNHMIHLKNRATIDPRKAGRRFYEF